MLNLCLSPSSYVPTPYPHTLCPFKQLSFVSATYIIFFGGGRSFPKPRRLPFFFLVLVSQRASGILVHDLRHDYRINSPVLMYFPLVLLTVLASELPPPACPHPLVLALPNQYVIFVT